MEMSEGCFRRLRSLPRGTCLFLQNGDTKRNSKPDTAQSMFYVKISHVWHCLVSKLALLGYGNRLAPLFKILNYCFQGGVTPICPVLALATAYFRP